jgi:hypothetical protein
MSLSSVFIDVQRPINFCFVVAMMLCGLFSWRGKELLILGYFACANLRAVLHKSNLILGQGVTCEPIKKPYRESELGTCMSLNRLSGR